MEFIEIEIEVPEPVKAAIAATDGPEFWPVGTVILSPLDAIGVGVILVRRDRPYIDLVCAMMDARRMTYLSFEDGRMMDDFIRGMQS
jgi:hypothetical protein